MREFLQSKSKLLMIIFGYLTFALFLLNVINYFVFYIIGWYFFSRGLSLITVATFLISGCIFLIHFQKKIVRGIVIGISVFLCILVLSWSWQGEGTSYNATFFEKRVAPRLRICHSGGMSSFGEHCHWVWEYPHGHAQ